jgi:hypothetical protein
MWKDRRALIRAHHQHTAQTLQELPALFFGTTPSEVYPPLRADGFLDAFPTFQEPLHQTHLGFTAIDSFFLPPHVTLTVVSHRNEQYQCYGPQWVSSTAAFPAFWTFYDAKRPVQWQLTTDPTAGGIQSLILSRNTTWFDWVMTLTLATPQQTKRQDSDVSPLHQTAGLPTAPGLTFQGIRFPLAPTVLDTFLQESCRTASGIIPPTCACLQSWNQALFTYGTWARDMPLHLLSPSCDRTTQPPRTYLPLHAQELASRTYASTVPYTRDTGSTCREAGSLLVRHLLEEPTLQPMVAEGRETDLTWGPWIQQGNITCQNLTLALQDLLPPLLNTPLSTTHKKHYRGLQQQRGKNGIPPYKTTHQSSTHTLSTTNPVISPDATPHENESHHSIWWEFILYALVLLYVGWAWYRWTRTTPHPTPVLQYPPEVDHYSVRYPVHLET